jgi:hypothetical protein
MRLPLTFLLAASLAFAPVPVKKSPPKVPTIGYVGALATEDYVLLRFEASNPGDAPLPYHGFEPDRDIKEAGFIVPQYEVEVSDGKEWKPSQVGYVGYRAGKIDLPAGGKGTFNVLLPGGEWKQVRVGLRCYGRGDREKPTKAHWSASVSRDDAKPPRK